MDRIFDAWLTVEGSLSKNPSAITGLLRVIDGVFSVSLPDRGQQVHVRYDSSLVSLGLLSRKLQEHGWQVVRLSQLPVEQVMSDDAA